MKQNFLIYCALWTAYTISLVILFGGGCYFVNMLHQGDESMRMQPQNPTMIHPAPDKQPVPARANS